MTSVQTRVDDDADRAAEVVEELRPLLATVRDTPPLDLTGDPTALRAQADAGIVALDALFGAPRQPVATDDHQVAVAGGTVPVRIYRPTPRPDVAAGAVHVHLHGGGWWMGSIATADTLCRVLADRTGLTVISIGYRLAPAHRWPTAPRDVFTVLGWLVDNADTLGLNTDSMTLGGESAGANVAAATALMARDSGGPTLVGLWLDIPPLDLTLPDTPSMRAFGSGYGLDVTGIEVIRDWYVDGPDRTDPYASPAHATTLAGLPATIVTTAELDPLRDQGEAFAVALETAGVPVTAIRTDGHLHTTAWLTALSASGAAWHARMVTLLTALHRNATVSAPAEGR